VLGRTDRGGSLGHHHVHLEPDPLGCQVAKPFLASLRIPVLNDEVLALDVAECAQTLPESCNGSFLPILDKGEQFPGVI
jgi:hypothetical protein